MAVNDVKSILTPRLCLTWETEKPLGDKPRESPVFRFMNHDWCLKLNYSKMQPLDYRVSIEKITESKFPEFSVDTHFVHSSSTTVCLFHQRSKVAYSRSSIWSVCRSDLLSRVYRFEEGRNFTLVFVFQRYVHQRDLSVINDFFKFPLTWKDYLALDDEAALTSLDLPLNFDSLSNEFANMLEKNIFPDVQLKSADRVIPAHRAVLAARSEVFAAMFRHDMSESSSGIINIEDIDTPVVDAFLKYLYSGNIAGFNLTEDFVMKLFEVSDKYSVHSLRKICSLHMIKNITCDNFITFLRLADSHSDKDFKKAIICIIMKNNSWLESESWLRFAPENTILATEVFCKYFSK